MIETVAAVTEVRFDIAAIVTGVSLVITAVATFIVAVRDRKSNGDGNAKAIAVTEIVDTGKKVETLMQQVEFLFEEISKLREQKENLERRVNRLSAELKKEKADHAETKARLEALLIELHEKNKKIKDLENQLIQIQEKK